MTDKATSEALRLAAWLTEGAWHQMRLGDVEAAWRELRRQHARIAELEAQLEAIGAGGVSGPLMGQSFDAADMATASAQGFRDGVASLAASAGSEPVAWQYRSVRDKGLWFDCTEERAKQRAAHPETWDVRYLYTHPSPPEGMVGGWIASKDQMPPPGVRVFCGDVDSDRVGYDFWAGDDYRWAPSHWMHIPEFPTTPTSSADSRKGGEHV